jgi:hypothetical protein
MPNDQVLPDAIRSLAPCADDLVLNYWRELLGGENRELDSALRDLVRRSEEKLRK